MKMPGMCEGPMRLGAGSHKTVPSLKGWNITWQEEGETVLAEVEKLETNLSCPADVEGVIDVLAWKACDREGRRRYVAIRTREWASPLSSWYRARTKRLQLRRQVAATADKKGSVSLSPFMEVNNLELEEELSAMATLCGWENGK